MKDIEFQTDMSLPLGPGEGHMISLPKDKHMVSVFCAFLYECGTFADLDRPWLGGIRQRRTISAFSMQRRPRSWRIRCLEFGEIISGL